jgi:hypothetical protein
VDSKVARRSFLAGILGTGAAIAVPVAVFGKSESALAAGKPTAKPSKTTTSPTPTATSATPTPTATATPTPTATATPTPTATSTTPTLNDIYEDLYS